MTELIANNERLRTIRAKMNASLMPFASREEFEGATIPVGVPVVHAIEGGEVYQLLREAGGDWVAGDGSEWRSRRIAPVEEVEALRDEAIDARDDALAAVAAVPLAQDGFATVQALLDDTDMTYVAGEPKSVVVGQRVRVGRHLLEVAASNAVGADLLQNSNLVPVKFIVLPNDADEIEWSAFAPVSGAANHGTQWAAAVAALARHGVKVLRVNPGTWRLQYVTVPEGVTVKCAPWLTIFRPVSAEDRAIFTQDSGSASVFLDGMRFEHATFQGAETTPTFSEQKHLVTIHGIDGAQFIDCRWIGWRGDALYLGSSDTGGTTERHNRNVHVIRNHFDGVNNENRQAISAIDIDGLYVRDSYFVNCTKSTMPGAIDLEPNNNAFHIIKNVWIEGNQFVNCGGNVGTITVFHPTAVPLPNNINILYNKGVNLTLSAGGGFVGIDVNRVLTDTDIDMGIRIEGNDVRGSTGRPYQFLCGKGIRARGNIYSDFVQNGIVAFTGATDNCRDVSISDTFIRCGTSGDEAIHVFTVTNLDMTGSAFDDCGDGTAGSCAIRFGTGTSSGVKLNDIRIVSPTGKTQRAVQRDAGHTFTPATNQHYGCQWGTLANQFEAHESDTIFTTYTPVVEGASTAGTGTYTRQFGRWRRIGRQVFFEVEIVQTGHTGTGLIEISLPVNVNPSSNNELRAVAIALDGAATTGGQVGLINPGAVAGGVTGAVRCHHTATGTLTQTTVPSGAATYRAAGSYMAA